MLPIGKWLTVQKLQSLHLIAGLYDNDNKIAVPLPHRVSRSVVHGGVRQ
jgi:hypothetical protein